MKQLHLVSLIVVLGTFISCEEPIPPLENTDIEMRNNSGSSFFRFSDVVDLRQIPEYFDMNDLKNRIAIASERNTATNQPNITLSSVALGKPSNILKELHFFNLGITIPSDISKEEAVQVFVPYIPSLVELEIDSKVNFQIHFPAGMSLLKRITVSSKSSGEPLELFPNIDNLPALEELTLIGSLIQSIPDGPPISTMKRLTLGIQDPELRNLERFPNLISLGLSGNFGSIESIGKLKNLESLGLRGNIMELDFEPLVNLTKLTILQLGNGLETLPSLPEEMRNRVNILYLAYNQLTDTNWISSFPSLKWFDAEENPIRTVRYLELLPQDIKFFDLNNLENAPVEEITKASFEAIQNAVTHPEARNAINQIMERYRAGLVRIIPE